MVHCRKVGVVEAVLPVSVVPFCAFVQPISRLRYGTAQLRNEQLCSVVEVVCTVVVETL